MGGFSIWHWLIVLVIVVLVFGTKRLKNVGKDLGDAVKGFKDGVRDDDPPPAQLRDLPPGEPSPTAPSRVDPTGRVDATVDPAIRRHDAAPGDDAAPR